MKVRAITLGYDIYQDSTEMMGLKNKLTEIQDLKANLEQFYEVEYIRLASPPFTNKMPLAEISECINSEIPEILETFVAEKLLGIYSFAPGLLDFPNPLDNTHDFIVSKVSQLITSHPNLFSSIQLGSNANGINFQSIGAAAEIIQNLSHPDPFRNVQFAATFNVPPNTPFFPSAYHEGSQPKISIALEAADELVNLFLVKNVNTTSLMKLRQEIQSLFRKIYDQITEVVISFCDKHHIEFSGIDFSPAPYPTIEKSIGNALEQLMIAEFGSVGSVFSIGFITEALQSVNRPKIGFSGFMQPLLEDAVIAQRNNEEKLDISKLMLYSTMCGLGLDCIPIPGNLPADAIKSLLLDLGMMSIRLKKPLTARLMPISGKKSGEKTNFSFEYFTDSNICSVDYFPRTTWKDFTRHNSHFNF
ncbi:MAG: hypothetical protein DRO88_03450 [Promethearchaeia archaeon]|nr:MAG: hypothetical protein DRO88_03450 [Candidatus Lokiarchaeia archaeon]